MRYIVLKPLTVAMGMALLVTGCNSGPGADEAARQAPAASASTVPPATHVSSAFDVSDLDTSIDPCVDFNAFVNSKWVKANPIPADKTRWGAFDALAEKSLNDQHALVDAAAEKADGGTPGSIEQKIGWYYKSGMDEAAIDARGFEPIKPELDAVDALKTPQDLVAWIIDAHAQGRPALFHFGSGADFRNASMQIAYARQGGLKLPTTDYYSKPEHAAIREAYLKHVAQLFELVGDDAGRAATRAKNVLAVETRLAEHSIPRVEMRKPENQYHFVSVDEANALTPHFDWKRYLDAQGVRVDKGFSLSQPGFFAEFDRMLGDVPMATWRDYLAAHAIDNASELLSKPFQDADFAFYGKTLNGQPEQAARWKRVLGSVNASMGMALGEIYVDHHFSPAAKSRALELVDNVRNALKTRIEHLDWMSDSTRAKALAKWETFLPKIGYPDKWRSWDGLDIRADDYFANVRSARKFNRAYDLAKIGQSTDRQEWFMSPQTVNAYYNPTDNTINFPAAILQPPFFYADGDDGINYGGIGAVIGHEIGHGFDDQGSQFDAQGNNANWWTPEDRARFEERTQLLVDQYNAYVPLANYPDRLVDGRLTLGENIGDLGGMVMAYDALQTALKQNPQEAAAKIDGYTEDQRFFMNWARVWRGSIRDEAQLVRLASDPHAPAQFRAAGPAQNMPAFAEAFSCKEGDPMVRPAEKRVRIW